jgi:hypothetical protein
MASNALTNLRGRDPGANRQTDAISRLVEPVAKAVMATPIMGAKPPVWISAELTGGFASFPAVVVPRYHRDALGYVHVQASMITAAGCAAFTTFLMLPKGYRPNSTLIFVGEDSFAVSAFVAINVLPNGSMRCVPAIAAGHVISFCFDYLAEQ